MRPRIATCVLSGILALALAAAVPAAGQARLDEKLLEGLTYRNLGPFRAGSWITDFAVPEFPERAHLYTFYVGTRNGGVWKTVNNGTTFEPIFDGQKFLSIGALGLAPSSPETLYVGTGEAFCARSSNRGDGVHKTTDGGRTWTHLGLEDTHHIARIAVHPRNPDIVYVAAMGYLFSENEERGVFKTEDGGATWRKVLYINSRVGVIDLAMNPSDPDVLYAAAYDKVRYPWHYENGGPESAIYKTTDGGGTWRRLDKGLPSGRIGRIGLDIYRKNPDILYAVFENANRRPPTVEEAAMDRRFGLEPREREVGGEVYRSDDAGETWRLVTPAEVGLANKAPYSFNMLRIDPSDDQTVYVTGVTLASTNDGGKTWKSVDWPPDGVFRTAFGDVRTLWIDPRDSQRIMFGSDGGVYVSYDRGETCHLWYNIPLGELYTVSVDMEDPYNIYVGLQDHDSWKGPSYGWAGRITLSDWVTVGGGDGMYNQVHPKDGRWLYNNREFGAMWRLDQKLGFQTLITPRRGPGKPAARFNWTPPILLSPHDPAVVYVGAQVVCRSGDRGETWEEISPDLTTDDKSKQGGAGHITFCTITTLAESPVEPGVIWSGADDGKVQVTRDGGASWRDVTAAIAAAGGPERLWVSRVFASPHAAGTAFVSKTGWRETDETPYLFKTADYGETWTLLSAGLPENAINAVVQDHRNPGLLFVGTERGVYVSIDGGGSWAALKNNMPWAKVTDLVVHPRENDLVVATYGRGAFITDITPLQQMNAAVLDRDVHLFTPRPKVQRVRGGIGNYHMMGDSHLATPNEPEAVVVRYYLKNAVRGPVKITVTGRDGEVLSVLDGETTAGLHAVLWDMTRTPPGEEARPVRRRREVVDPGEYRVVLEAAGRTFEEKIIIPRRTGWAYGPHPTIILEAPDR